VVVSGGRQQQATVLYASHRDGPYLKLIPKKKPKLPENAETLKQAYPQAPQRHWSYRIIDPSFKGGFSANC
jgi:hypothetical protein